jgi:hypothetical protein
VIQRELNAGHLRTLIALLHFDMSLKVCVVLGPLGLQIVGSLAEVAPRWHPPQRTTCGAAGISATRI